MDRLELKKLSEQADTIIKNWNEYGKNYKPVISENYIIDTNVPMLVEHTDFLDVPSQAELDEIYEQIVDLLGTDYLEEGFFQDVAKVGFNIPAIFRLMGMYLTKSYVLKYTQYKQQSQQINDTYQKIADLYANNTAARAKHANDRVDVSTSDMYLKDKKNNKLYYLKEDITAYNTDYIQELVEDIVDRFNRDKSTDYKALTSGIIALITDDFNRYHWFINECNVIIKTYNYKNVKFEQAIKALKSYSEMSYAWIYYLNQILVYELQAQQIVEKSYKYLLGKYGKSKEHKYVIDTVYKYLLQNVAKSMEYNDNIITLKTECLTKFGAEVDRLYAIITS